MNKLSLVMIFLLSACSGEKSPAGVPRCTPGTQTSCACDGGSSGVQVCDSAGSFGPCRCQDAGGSVDVSAPLDVSRDQGALVVDVIDDVSEPLDACATCSYPNARATCINGACSLAGCLDGFADCDGMNLNGCEASTNEAANCGVCRNRCPSGVACVAGACAGACSAPMTWCGRCVDVSSDLRNCGRCDNSCPNDRVCIDGGCRLPCDATTGDCDGNAANGCETRLGTGANCAVCGHRCDAPRVCMEIRGEGGLVTGHLCR